MKPTNVTNKKIRANNGWGSFALMMFVISASLSITTKVYASTVEKAMPFVNLTEKIQALNYMELEEDMDFLEDEYKGILTEKDWETLSLSEIDAKLKKAGKDSIGDEKDPLYKMNPTEIEKLTDEDWEKINDRYEKIYGENFEEFEEDMDFLEDEYKGILTEKDWDTLSEAQIDAKLKKAGKEPIGNEKDPLYKMTPAEIDKLTDADWEKLEAQYKDLYGDAFGEDCEIMEDEYKGILTEKDWETLSQFEIDAKLKKAGKEPIGDTRDPFYKMKPSQIDNLSEKELERLELEYEKLFEK